MRTCAEVHGKGNGREGARTPGVRDVDRANGCAIDTDGDRPAGFPAADTEGGGVGACGCDIDGVLQPFAVGDVTDVISTSADLDVNAFSEAVRVTEVQRGRVRVTDTGAAVVIVLGLNTGREVVGFVCSLATRGDGGRHGYRWCDDHGRGVQREVVGVVGGDHEGQVAEPVVIGVCADL